MAEMAQNKRKKSKKTLQNLIVTIIILIVLIGIPFMFLRYQARKSGMNITEVLQRKLRRNVTGTSANPNDTTGARIDFLTPSPIGDSYTEPPLISNITVADVDKDGLIDVIVCDARDNFVSWIRQYPIGQFNEQVIVPGLIAPAHAQVDDFDGDGDNDILVAVLGMLFPNNDKIGSVVILENTVTGFVKHTVLEKVARVSDVRAGDLDGDGDKDLAVAQFGYDDGETRWLENKGNWTFESHILQKLSGPINVEINDYDGDGDPDICSLASQEWEEIWCFANDGKGNFTPQLLWGSSNEDFGSSGIYSCDIDKDGDDDILYTNGDAFDYIPPVPRPWHGVSWLENKGNMKFEYHRICDFPGAFNARPADIDKDGDFDIFVISGFSLWDKPESRSFMWLENNGSMQFIRHDIASSPTHLITLEEGDFNNDGLMDFVTGGMHTYPPYDRMGRVTLWMNKGFPVKR